MSTRRRTIPHADGSLKGPIVLPTPSSLYARALNVRALAYALTGGWVLTAGILAAGNPAAEDQRGQDPPSIDYGTRFVEKLRERGWHDVALEYLERADEDPLASADFLANVDYELAVTRAHLARLAVGDKERQSLQDQAITGFEKYAQDHPTSRNAVDALSRVSNMLAEQAVLTLNKADRLPPQAENERQSLRDRARETIDKAGVAAARSLEGIDKWLGVLPRGAALQADKEAAAFKQDLLTRQAEGRFLAANLNYEKARTFASGSPEHDEALDEAAAGFQQLQKEYENKLVGFYAVLYEGRCYQSAGNLKKALDTFGEVVRQPVGQGEFRKLIARAYRHRAECHLANGDADKVIEECEGWLNESRGEELTQPEWLAVQFRLGEAYTEKAADDTGNGNISQLRTNARKLFREVSRHPGEFQDDARAALAISGSETVQVADVSNFADAFAAGKDAIEHMTSMQLAAKLAANNNPTAVAELEDQVATNRAAAIKYFEQAVQLVDDKTPPEDVVAARYYLCWLYWEEGRTHEAADLGKQIAQDHADSPFAVTAAKVTLAAYERMYLEARESGLANDITASAQKLREIAELIVGRWNDSDAAATATNLLISIALRENNFDEADRLLSKLPESSRGVAGISVGATLWSQYLQEAASGGESLPLANQLRDRATKLLATGYDSLADAKDLSKAQAAGVVYYVQALLAEGDADKALEVLENKQVGPLAVMKRNGESEKSLPFAIETSKAALRAYLSVDPPRHDDAVAMMEHLEALTGDSEQAKKQLTAIYINLGLQLHQQIKQLSSAGNDDKAQTVAAAFASLLSRVAERGGSQSWEVKNWLAQASLQLGSGLSGSQASRYLEQAEQAYRDILATAEKEPNFAPSEMALLAVRKKLGETLQARGDFSGALDEFTAILAKKPSLLEIQEAAASSLQAWGITKKDVEPLELSIRGTDPGADGKNRVWGWLRLAQVADFAKRKAEASDKTAESAGAAKKYEEVYFRARLQAAKARLAAAKLSQGDSQTKQLATVRQSINALKQLYPDLGGAQWHPQFDAVLKEAGG